LLLLGTWILASTWALAEDKKEGKKRENTAIKPSKKDEKRHEGFVAIAKKGHIDVLFLGDSITDGWRGKPGIEVWNKHFKPLKAANFGIGGDRTQHVLWRLQNGELEGITPKAAVLMIGTNNLGSNTAEEIAGGITAIVKEIHHKSPHTKVLLLGIFPRSPKSADSVRDKIKDINHRISNLGKHKNVKYLDIGKKFLQKDGTLTKEIMPDYLHLSGKGYQIWAEAIEGEVKQLLEK
jgi:lysophospholipase L1-like esterase